MYVHNLVRRRIPPKGLLIGTFPISNHTVQWFLVFLLSHPRSNLEPQARGCMQGVWECRQLGWGHSPGVGGTQRGTQQ